MPNAERPATHDLLRAPPGKIAEIVCGELVISSRPMRQVFAASRLAPSLSLFDRSISGDAPGGWQLLDMPELHLGDDVLVPALAGWRRERLPAIPDAAFLTLPPDWICERSRCRRRVPTNT
jgi:hypothetical protein